jgi:hypothetical protein
MQAADLQLCHAATLTSLVRAPRASAKRPWSLRERLSERDIANLITAYRDGATAASLATAHGVSLRSVKRLLRRRCPPDLTHATSYKKQRRPQRIGSRFGPGFHHPLSSMCGRLVRVLGIDLVPELVRTGRAHEEVERSRPETIALSDRLQPAYQISTWRSSSPSRGRRPAIGKSRCGRS